MLSSWKILMRHFFDWRGDCARENKSKEGTDWKVKWAHAYWCKGRTNLLPKSVAWPETRTRASLNNSQCRSYCQNQRTLKFWDVSIPYLHASPQWSAVHHSAICVLLPAVFCQRKIRTKSRPVHLHPKMFLRVTIFSKKKVAHQDNSANAFTTPIGSIPN